MSQRPPGYQRFFAELKRRKVFRVAAVYGATAFVVVQAADLAFVRLGLPPWTVTLVLALAVFGFPIALVLAWAFEATPEGMRRTEGASPGEVERIAAQPASKRWPSGLLALAGVALLVAGAWWVGRRSAPGGSAGAAPAAAADTAAAAGQAVAPVGASIAVLPFADMSPAGDQEHFSDGISEELLNLLARVRELRVAARTSSFAFKGEELPIPVIADSLGVAHVLEGSVRKAGEEVRITAQLIRADDGYHVWSESWDRTLEDVFAVQDEIAAEVVDRLRVTLLEDEAPTVEETDPEAYALALRARHLTDQADEANLARGEELYRQALAIDSTYAAGWSGLALNYLRQAEGGVASNRVAHPFERSRRAAERALAVDPDHARAHAQLAFLAVLEGDLAAAARRYQRALALAPGDARNVGRAGVMLMSLGRVEEAIRVQEYQVARDPVNAAGHLNLGSAYLAAGRPEAAVASYRTAVELIPDRPGLRSSLGNALLHAGEPEAALAEMREEPNPVWRLTGQAMAHHALGRAAESDAALAELIEGWAREAAYQVAQVVAFRGEVDRAFAWLDRAVEHEDPGLASVLITREFDALKDDPRWSDFLERIGKSPEDLDAIEFEVDLPGPADRAAAGG